MNNDPSHLSLNIYNFINLNFLNLPKSTFLALKLERKYAHCVHVLLRVKSHDSLSFLTGFGHLRGGRAKFPYPAIALSHVACCSESQEHSLCCRRAV